MSDIAAQRSEIVTSKKAILVDLNGRGEDHLSSVLETGAGYSVTSVGSLAEIEGAVNGSAIDLIVLAADAVDEGLRDLLAKLLAEVVCPTAFFCPQGVPECIRAAVEAGVHACSTVDGGTVEVIATVEAAKAQFANIASLRKELADAKTALEDRKLIERAKGIVMREKGLDEDSAYKLLRSRAMQKGQRLAFVARTIIEAADVMATEGVGA